MPRAKARLLLGTNLFGKRQKAGDYVGDYDVRHVVVKFSRGGKVSSSINSDKITMVRPSKFAILRSG